MAPEPDVDCFSTSFSYLRLVNLIVAPVDKMSFPHFVSLIQTSLGVYTSTAASKTEALCPQIRNVAESAGGKSAATALFPPVGTAFAKTCSDGLLKGKNRNIF